MIATPIVDRFWDRVLVLPCEGGCWAYIGYTMPRMEHGIIREGPRGGKAFLAHRFAYELLVGPIPEGKQVNHRCNNAWCVNPDHLYAGTAAENTRDMMVAGRHVAAPQPGERNPNAFLNDVIVIDIRTRAANGTKNVVLAREYGVTPTTIGGIVKGRSWKHVS